LFKTKNKQSFVEYGGRFIYYTEAFAGYLVGPLVDVVTVPANT